ncbi:hypothetical protein ACIRD3_32310 [Kitasatospora sp. NPDC093550]|uniref:hypothetical protein n=1 Tax=Kitasatospora sp. NPDC093550 TaxID=3364089 RepID=UPI0037F8BAF9
MTTALVAVVLGLGLLAGATAARLLRHGSTDPRDAVVLAVFSGVALHGLTVARPMGQRAHASYAVRVDRDSRDRGGPTAAFEAWESHDRDIRAFISLSTAWSSSGFKAAWQSSAEQHRRRGGRQRELDRGDWIVFNTFDEKVHGLWQHNYAWMLEASALKDAVTAFEIYLEHVLHEVLKQHRVRRAGLWGTLHVKVGRHQQSPAWPILAKAHEVLGAPVDQSPIKEIRAIRHLLTHQRGELRTPELRERWKDHLSRYGVWTDEDWEFIQARVDLGEAKVLGMMDALARVVRVVDGGLVAMRDSRSSLPVGQLCNEGCVVFTGE